MTEEKSKEEACAPVEESTVSVPTSNWWSPWLEAAKVKSTEVLEFVKKDLTEISTVVKSEASSVVNQTANVLKDALNLEEPNGRANSVKRSVSSFLGTVSSVLSPLPDDEDQEAIIIQNDTPVPLSKFQTKLFDLIKDPDTFLKEIDEVSMPQYTSWLGILEDQLSTERLTKQLVASPELHDQYEKLVPEQVSHITFWKRYLFRKAVLEDEESRREAKDRKDKIQAEQIQWEKEDFAKNIELSEEDQIKLLSDYENEKKGSVKVNITDEEELKLKTKKETIVVESGTSSHVSTSSADTEGKDTSDDWEKDFDLEDSVDDTIQSVK